MRRQRLHMLEITVANDFSVLEHVQDLTVKSAQTIYALRVLRAHRLKDAALQQVHRSVVVARLLYAASALHGFTKATDRLRINLLLERAKRHGYCLPDLPTFEELCNAADDQLFNKTVSNCNHVYTVYCHHHLQRRSTIILSVVCTHFRFPSTAHIYLTVILSFICYINTVIEF